MLILFYLLHNIILKFDLVLYFSLVDKGTRTLSIFLENILIYLDAHQKPPPDGYCIILIKSQYTYFLLL